MTPNELKELELARKAIRDAQAPIHCSTSNQRSRAAVIVVSYERPKMLETAVEQLQQQDYPELQIVVIDSSPKAHEKFCSFPPKDDRRLVYVTSQIPSLCIVRNLGLLAASSEIVIFVDDDVYLDTDFVSRHVALHQNGMGKEAYLVAGNSIPSPEEKSPWVATQVHYRPKGRLAAGVYGVNFSVKRKAALSCGGFNPYIRQIGDETELFGRLIRNEHEALNGREVVVVHRAARSGGGRYKPFEYDKIAMRMADRALVEAMRNRLFYLLPMFICLQVAKSLNRKEISVRSLTGISSFLKEFIWYCLKNSIRARRFDTFISESLKRGKPRVLKGKKETVSPLWR